MVDDFNNTQAPLDAGQPHEGEPPVGSVGGQATEASGQTSGESESAPPATADVTNPANFVVTKRDDGVVDEFKAVSTLDETLVGYGPTEADAINAALKGLKAALGQ